MVADSDNLALDELLTRFVRELRLEGIDVPANAAIDAGRALQIVGIDKKSRVRAALRATLISRKTDIEPFNELFEAFWRAVTQGISEEGVEGRLSMVRRDSEAPDEDGHAAAPEDDEGSDTADRIATPESGDTDPEMLMDETPGGGPSSFEGDESESIGGPTKQRSLLSRVGAPDAITRHQFDESDELPRAVVELTNVLGTLSGRRWESAVDGEVLDARRALRRSFSTGGTVPQIPRRSRRESDVRAVLLVDVSQSVLDTVDRGFLLRFLQLLCEQCRAVRIFFFDTDVREVSDAFGRPTIEHAMATLQRAETEWGGGTRIAHSLKTIRTDYPYAIDRRTAVLVISDGLEADDIGELRREMATLAGRSGILIWLNPLAASPAYEPTARGMAVSVPYVDGVFSFATPTDLTDLSRQLRTHGPGGQIGFAHDHRDRPIQSR